MEIAVHRPSDTAARAELARRVAETHGEAVLAYIKSLPVSQEEKRTLWRSVVLDGGGVD